jgi:hypothetical protein
MVSKSNSISHMYLFTRDLIKLNLELKNFPVCSATDFYHFE